MVKPYVEYWLKELKSCSSRIIFVANGRLSEEGRKLVVAYTSDIYVRLNIGLDAGAYKSVICNYLKNDLSGYDEVIFCNDSCWGPFIPLKDIFAEMNQHEDADFWGMCYTENNFANHIPGMFMVFKKQIIEKNLLQTYMNTWIDETTVFRNYVIASYEIGLFDFLVRKNNMKFSYYSSVNNLDIYMGAEICIRKYGFPVLKRRVGEKTYYEKDKILSTLAYIQEKNLYDINIIIDDLLSEYGIQIKKEEIASHEFANTENELTVFVSPHTHFEISSFVKERPFYIMGAKHYAMLAWWLYGKDNENFCGFFVSDGQPIENNSFFKEKLYFFSEINLESKNVLVAIRHPTSDIYLLLKNYTVLYLNK